MKQWITSPEQYKGLQKGRLNTAQQNLAANTAAFAGSEGKLLHGQGGETLKKLTYGKNSLSWCGCELIAVANAMLLTGHSIPLPEIVFEFEMNKMQLLLPSGYFGTSPKKIRRYFEHKGVPFHSFKRVDELERYIADKDTVCGILSFWNREIKGKGPGRLLFFTKGLHTVAFLKKHSSIYIYNRRNSASSASKYDSISEVIGDRRFILYYVLDEDVKS